MAARERVPSTLQDYVITNIGLGKEIGRGANGRILEAKWEGTVVAVKEIHSIFTEASEVEFQSFKRSFLRECEQSSRLRHPNIVRFLGIYQPSGARVPSLVMERLHCSLTTLLEQNPVIQIGTKLSILYDVSLGLRYLHAHIPPIIHRDLSSNNVLLSRGMEGKIGDLGTARLVDPRRQSRMTQAPGTVIFMPPEALEDSSNIHYGRELDVFSFGCVMLHTLSHEWPTPLQAVITDPETGVVKGGRSEAERRHAYFDKIDRSLSGVLVPLIVSCLGNLPKNRTSIARVCDQLEEHVPTDGLTTIALQQEIQARDAEIQARDVEIWAVRAGMSNLQITSSSKQVNKSSTDFWNSLKLTWQECADLPLNCWATSVAELDGKVYVTVVDAGGSYVDPLMYDSIKDQWSALPPLPYARFSLVTVPEKKQLLAIGGSVNNGGVIEVSNKVFLWNEEHEEWLTPYPDMPTARFHSSSISHGSAVIVAGGKTCYVPHTMTRAVEVLHINDRNLHDSHWTVVEQLPHLIQQAVPLIVNDTLYIAVGYGTNDSSTCNVVSASLPELLQSNKNNTSSGQVWHKLPDMPYCSFSINHYQGRLITFSGDYRVEQPGKDKPVYELAPLIHIYNPNTTSWDYVGDIPHGYYLGISIHIRENKILFVGGICDLNKNNNVQSCSVLTFTQK